MKKILVNILAISALILGFASCEKSNLDPLEGVFQKPVDVTYTSAVLNGIQKTAGSRTFDVTFKGGASDLEIFFVGNKYYINPTAYGAKSAKEAGVNNYIAETSKYGSAAIKTGTLTLKADSDTWTEGVNYTISGTVWTNDGQIIRVSGTVPMSFVEDIDPDTMSDTVTPLGAADLHSISLYNALGSQTASIIILTNPNATSLAGNYAVAGFYSVFTAGYAWAGYDYSSIGYGIGGTGYYSEGKFVPIADGTVAVTKNDDGTYTFEMGGQKFYGKNPNTAEDAETVAGEVTNHNITIKDPTTGETLAALVLNRTTGASLAGKYNVVAYYSSTVDYSAWAGGVYNSYVYGSYYNVDGATTTIQAGSTIEIKAAGTAYIATIGDFSISFQITK